MPAKFERCVEHVREQGGKANPYAVCHASLDKEFTKEDNNKLSQILKELKEIKGDLEKGKARKLQMLGYAKRHQTKKGGEGSGVKGHKMETGEEKSKRQEKERRKYIEAEKWKRNL